MMMLYKFMKFNLMWPSQFQIIHSKTLLTNGKGKYPEDTWIPYMYWNL